MNYLVCALFVIGTLTAGRTVKQKREVAADHYDDNQINQQDAVGTSQTASDGYGNVQGGYGTIGIDQNSASPSEGRISHVTINRQIPVPQPVPVPVEVENKIPFPVHVSVPVPVDRPYYVKIRRPYPVPVYKDVPYAVYKDVPVPVKYAVEVPYLVRVPVLVPQPFPIPIDVPVKVPVPDVQVIRKPVVLEHQERVNGGGDVVSEDDGALDVAIGGGNGEIGTPEDITGSIDDGGSTRVGSVSAGDGDNIGEKH